MTTTRSKNEAFFKANAAKGRSVRFLINIDVNHVPDEEAKKHRLVGVKITQGTLTPEVARKILDLVFDVVKDSKNVELTTKEKSA